MTSSRVLRRAVALAIAGFSVPTVFAQDTGSQPQAAGIESVIVTGTRSAGRTSFEALAPIDVIDGDAIGATVSPDLNDSLAQLLPSFNVQRLPAGDEGLHVRPARLRALDPGHTLVLINGKRRHRSAQQAIDLAQIPSSAIGRTEVLRDGASAQYGSNAIAGVINIMLDDRIGYSLSTQASSYYEGDGNQYRVTGKAGYPLRSDGEGTIVFFAEYSDESATSRTRQRPDALAFQAAHPELNVPNPVQRWGKPDREAFRGGFNLNTPVTDNTEFYAFATYGESEGVGDFNWRNPASTSAYLGSPLDPDYNLHEIFPTGFTPRFGSEDEDMSLFTGIRSSAGEDLSWDVSLGGGRNEINWFMNESINGSLGSQSPTDFGSLGLLTQTDYTFNADGVYLWQTALAAPVNIAFGVEAREENFRVEAGVPASYEVGPLAVDGLPSGSNGFPGYSDTQAGDWNQQSWSLYTDVEVALTERLTSAVALRHESYSDFGSTTNYKLSGRFELSDDLALRGTLSTGFRAPTPAQQFAERTSQGLNSTTLNLVTNGRFSPTGPVADLINQRPEGEIILPLEPEESENLSLGLTWRSPIGVVVTLDAYRIDVKDRFSTRGGFVLTDADRAYLLSLGVPGGESITSASFNQNMFDTRTKGVDVVMSYGTELGGGRLNLATAYNYNVTEVTDTHIPGAFNAVSQRTFEEAIPGDNATFSADYALGRWNFIARARYYGDWTDIDESDAVDVIFQEFDAEVFVDVAVSYQVTEQLTLRLGAENVFDSYPDEATKQANRGLIYSRNSPYDTDGGKYYLNVSWRL